MLVTLGYTNFDIGIEFINNKTIAHYNATYRQKDGPTDILSFPFYPDLKAGDSITAKNPDEANLGDLMISLEYIHTSNRWKDFDPDEVLTILLVHGICHLLGYDHQTEPEYKLMQAKEEQLLASLHGI